MLSQDLRSLHVWWVEVTEGRAEFTAEGLRQFERVLSRAVEDAEAMEQTPLSLGEAGRQRRPFRAVPVADNVIIFPVVPRPVPRASHGPGGAA